MQMNFNLHKDFNSNGFALNSDPIPKSCFIQKHNTGMINTPLNGGIIDDKVAIHRRADCFCPEAG